MNAHHYKAAHWIGRGVFDGLTSFTEFEFRVNDIFEEKDRGDVFEIFIEGYLATQSITQHVEHWVVGDIPVEIRERFNLPKDGTGIDGIYEELGGNQVAYQVKYRKNHNLTFAEVAPFLGITEKFTDRVIFTNASSLSDKAAVRTRWYSGEVFNALTSVQFGQIEAWLKEKPAPVVRAVPDPSYQTQVLTDIAATLEGNARATVVMACGTGKTLVALWATEQAKPRTVLVLLPSLMLLQQTLREWSQHTSWGSRFSYLCVCSDKTVGLRNDSINIDKSDVGFKVDTDPELVRAFLERETDDIKVIFSTYHSTKVVAEGAAGLPPIDLAIFDEAHKTTTTGRAGGTMSSYALDDEKVRINKRLFLTATPRYIDIRKRDKEGDFRVQSMDDESLYGPRAHTLSFGAAANKGIICQYKVIISLIDKQMVDDFSRNNGITLIEGDEIGARWVSNLVALDQAVKKAGASKIISFHSRVAYAQEFATSEPRGIAHYLDGYDVRHVNGKQNSAVRSDAISAFAAAPHGVITNARCLTEGVDIPAVDMVAFIDPRQSRVDIVQAVGRAMRKPRGKTTKTVGYVLVPLFAGVDGDGLEEAIKTEKFDAIANVLNALQEHDEELVDIIRELKQRKGEDKPFRPKRLREKIEFIGPQVGFDKLVNSILVEITNRLGATWDEFYGTLVRFHKIYGHSTVKHKHPSHKSLATWVDTQRQSFKNGKLSAERIEKLNQLSFVWDVFAEYWDHMYQQLVTYKAEYGNCNVGSNYKIKGPSVDVNRFNFDVHLGRWVIQQRVLKNKGNLSPEQIELLNEIGFIWDLKQEFWDNKIEQWLSYKNKHNGDDPPQKHPVGRWLSNCRTAIKAGRLEKKKKIQLLKLGFVVEPVLDKLNDRKRRLNKFVEKNGHCLIPNDYPGDPGLGKWAYHLRNNVENVPPNLKNWLDNRGFVWVLKDFKWESFFIQLKHHLQQRGNFVFSKEDRKQNRYLVSWVGRQRTRYLKGTLREDRVRRLNEIGFPWNKFDELWQKNINILREIVRDTGSCYIDPDQYPELRMWASNLRSRYNNTGKSKKSPIPEERVRELDDLGFIWDIKSHSWEINYQKLVVFVKENGHAKVPRKYPKDPTFGFWGNTQRARLKRGTLQESQLDRLKEIGFL